MAKETRNIVVGPAMAMHMIRSQCGTLGKAIAEYCMNSVDSLSNRVDITLTADQVVIGDNGKGFGSRDDIEQFFDVLCFDHGPAEKDWRTYGKFGIGRAQLFEFAATVWRTRMFEMSVDIRNQGFAYDLESELDDAPGCLVTGTFYKPLTSSEIHSTISELTALVLYCPIPVYVNGERITCDPANEKWDHVTDEGFIRLTDGGGLSVYNLGILVRTYPGYQFGTSGVVLSKKKLDVNFARNDIMISRCPVWKALEPKIRTESRLKATRKPTLTDDERQNFISEWIAGDLTWSDVRELALIKCVTGRAMKVSTAFQRNPLDVALCADGDKMTGDTLHRSKLAWVMAPEMYSWFGLPNAGAPHAEKEAALSKRLDQLLPKESFKLRPISELAQLVDTSQQIVPEKELGKRDKAILAAMKMIACELARCANIAWETDCCSSRQIKMGRSESALGWTDGTEFIVIEQRHARQVRTGLPGIAKVLHTLMHEQAHLSVSIGEHPHGQDFFERFHDLARHQGELMQRFIKALVSKYRSAKIKLSPVLMAAADLHQLSVGYGDSNVVSMEQAEKPSKRRAQPRAKRAESSPKPKASPPRHDPAQIQIFGT